MELIRFIQFLLKRYYILILVPLISVAVTYFLVKGMPDTYRAQARISTGIVDETQRVVSVGGVSFQENKVNQDFTNVQEMLKQKKLVDQVSYSLIIHDLTDKTPFRKKSKLLSQLNPSAVQHALSIFREKYKNREALNLYDTDQHGLYDVLRSMHYDDESLKQNLLIYRAGTSDFIVVEFSSENAELSPYVVNALCNEFITYHNETIKQNQSKTVDYLGELLKQKYLAMNEKIAGLRDYKIKNRILNLYEQSKILYTNMMVADGRKEEAKKDVEAYTGAINNIDTKFDPKDRRYFESAITKINQDIMGTKLQLRALSDKYVESNFDNNYKKSVDSLQQVLNTQINTLTDKYVYDPLNTKKDLLGQKIALDVQRDIAKNSIQALSGELANLNGRFDKLVPFEAVVQSYERDIDVASREYLDILNKYNQVNIESGFAVKMKQSQIAMPSLPEANKKILLILLAGIISFAFCVIVLLIVFYLDDSINDAAQLAALTGLPVIGQLSHLKNPLPVSQIWGANGDTGELADHKNLVRSIRYETDSTLSNNQKIICITSLKPREGKSFLAMNLAHAFAMTNKKVLLIDGNFTDAQITQALKPDYYFEDVVANGFSNTYSNNNIMVLGNRASNKSLLEIADKNAIALLLDNTAFDLIIIETEALTTDNKVKEWALFAAKIVAVFASGKKLTNTDKQQLTWLAGTGKFSGWVFNQCSGSKK